MVYLITFSKHGEVLTRYEFEVTKAQEIAAHIDQANNQFRLENPNVSLFSGVRILYEKE